MNKLHRTFLLASVLLSLLTLGCAQSYHAYDGCSVDCKYCPPSPLPFTHFYGCACHSCAASRYAIDDIARESAYDLMRLR